MAAKSRFFMDPVHGFIVLSDELMLRLVDSTEFQRLRRIRQLGASFGTYHGAEHTRFGHSLGAFHLLERALASLGQQGVRLTPEQARLLRAGVLLHDVGHGPFSHALEGLITPGISHEAWGAAIIGWPGSEVHQILARWDPGFPQEVADLLVGAGASLPPWARALLSSQLDVDRMDYLLRDAHFTGSRYGLFDLDQLLRLLQVRDGELVVGPDGRAAVEEYVLARFFMYRRVYLHRTTRGHELLLHRAWLRARELAQAGRAEPSRLAPWLRWEPGRTPDGEAIRAYLSLDDSDIWYALKGWREDRDPILADLAARFLDRRLLKPLFREPIPALPEGFLEAASERVRQAGWDPAHYLMVDRVRSIAYDPYAPEPGRAPITVGGAEGPVELSRLSTLVAATSELARPAFQVYVPAEVRCYLQDLMPDLHRAGGIDGAFGSDHPGDDSPGHLPG